MADKPADKEPKLDVESMLSGLIQKSDAREQTIAQLAETQTETLSQLKQIQQQVAAVTSRPAQATPTGSPLSDLLGDSGKATPPVDLSSLPAMIQAAVNDAVAPVVNDITETKEKSQLQAAQQASYQQALTQVPELKDPSSPVSAVFEKFLDGRPDLQANPDGPLLAALVSKGLAADNKSEIQEQAQRKASASVDVGGTAPASPVAAIDSGLTDDYNAAGEIVEELSEKGSTQGLSKNEFTSLVGTALAKGITEQLNPTLSN